jgi:hypothetical protein
VLPQSRWTRRPRSHPARSQDPRRAPRCRRRRRRWHGCRPSGAPRALRSCPGPPRARRRQTSAAAAGGGAAAARAAAPTPCAACARSRARWPAGPPARPPRRAPTTTAPGTRAPASGAPRAGRRLPTRLQAGGERCREWGGRDVRHRCRAAIIRDTHVAAVRRAPTRTSAAGAASRPRDPPCPRPPAHLRPLPPPTPRRAGCCGQARRAGPRARAPLGGRTSPTPSTLATPRRAAESLPHSTARPRRRPSSPERPPRPPRSQARARRRSGRPRPRRARTGAARARRGAPARGAASPAGSSSPCRALCPSSTRPPCRAPRRAAARRRRAGGPGRTQPARVGQGPHGGPRQPMPPGVPGVTRDLSR